MKYPLSLRVTSHASSEQLELEQSSIAYNRPPGHCLLLPAGNRSCVEGEIEPRVSRVTESIRRSVSGRLRNLSTQPTWLAVDFHVVLYTHRAAQISIIHSTTSCLCSASFECRIMPISLPIVRAEKYFTEKCKYRIHTYCTVPYYALWDRQTALLESRNARVPHVSEQLFWEWVTMAVEVAERLQVFPASQFFAIYTHVLHFDFNALAIGGIHFPSQSRCSTAAFVGWWVQIFAFY